ncbi:hypothetical protein Tco_0282222 [Tanacetum coccineum]
MASISIGGVSQKSLINHRLNRFWSHVVWAGVVRWGIQSSSRHRCHDSSKSQETKRELSYVALAVLTTRPACHPSLTSCLSSHGESLLSMPDAYEYPATVAGSDVYGAGIRMHIPAHGGSEAHNGPPDLILSHEPKPLGKHRPPPLQSVLSPDELSYPP